MSELTVLYDGRCALCRASADRVRRLDREHRITLVDLHDPEVAARFPQIDPEQALRLMQAIDARGRVTSGVDAWAEICRALPGWRTGAWLLKLPGIHGAASQLYGWVARNRYRWNPEACADGACAVHVPQRR
ncbi:MAG TPA: DUF393 domain-containing protein [Patescibacteria group bacterium]|nr:DUF393 domain-containing protein [Patescibacteria group bacterium]